MATTEIRRGSGIQPPVEPLVSREQIEDSYQAFMDAWRVRDLLEARRWLVRCRQAIASRYAHDERLVEQARRCEQLLEMRSCKGSCVDGEFAHELVELRHAMAAHLG